MKSGGVYIIGEAATCHAGSSSEAHRLVEAASSAGCNAVKFQMIDPKHLYISHISTDEGFVPNPAIEKRQAERLSPNEWYEVRDHCRQLHLDFSATIFDVESLDFLLELNPEFIKVASTDLTHHSLLREIAKIKLPIVLSTGMATLDEVGEAVEIFSENGVDELTLLHCVSVYPCPSDLANLPRMTALRRFGVAVGFSDHTLGIGAGAAAVALGAVLVEKHMRLSDGPVTADYNHSLSESEMTTFVQALRDAAAGMVDRGNSPSAEELQTAQNARRGSYAAKRLNAGEYLQAGDIQWLRPKTDISPAQEDLLIGRKLLTDHDAGSALYLSDLER